MKYGARYRPRTGGNWRRVKQYRRVKPNSKVWVYWRSTFPTRLTAQKRLDQYKAKGFVGHTFGIDDRRDQIVHICRQLLELESKIHYAQIRPFDADGVKKLLNGKLKELTTDCSGSTTMIYRAAGLPDPNGLNYRGLGYTGTLREHLGEVAFHSLQKGDLIIYGRGSGVHVVIVMEAGVDPLVFSHGQENGPRLYRHSQQVRYHVGSYTCHTAGI